MNTPTSALSPGSSSGAPRRQSVGSDNGTGEVDAHGMAHWTSVGEKLTAEKNLAQDARKDLVVDITSNLRKLLEEINENNWMFDPIDMGYNNGQQR